MRKLLWLAAWSVVAVWSLFAVAAYGFVDFLGGLAMRNADMFSSDPVTVERIWHVFSFLHSASTSVALIVWGGVSLLVLSVPWLLDRMAGRSQVVVARATSSGQRGFDGNAGFAPGGAWQAAREGVIDLAPDQYSVRPAGTSPPAGSVPRVGPR